MRIILSLFLIAISLGLAACQTTGNSHQGDTSTTNRLNESNALVDVAQDVNKMKALGLDIGGVAGHGDNAPRVSQTVGPATGPSTTELTRAAEQGDTRSQYNLGLKYMQGQGVPQNYKTAVKWYTRAAEQGNADAQIGLGFIHLLQKDIIRAHMWMNIVASKGVVRAKKGRDAIAKAMTLTQLETAQSLADECVQKNYKGC